LFNFKSPESNTMLFEASVMLTFAAQLANGLSFPTQNPFGSSFGVPGDDVTYDYVIVGGGTAGLTIATRLVEQKAGTVGIIEAGTFYELSNGNLSEVPSAAGAFSGKGAKDWQPLIDWGYQTVPQKVRPRSL
jgi:choline dehydrogenase